MKRPQMPSRYVSIGVLLILVFFIFPAHAFAQEESTLVTDLGETMTMLIKFLSWVWIVPASIAGKLMTNDFTYGSAFYLDTYLWRLRTYMRQFAFFTLWFIFVVSIIKHIVKNDAPSKLWWLLMKVLSAGILIPTTWFVFGALIDISTVATSAVASFPLQIIEEQWNSLNTDITVQKKYIIKDNAPDPLQSNQAAEEPLDLNDIMPQADNVAWPLVFLWAAILKLMDTPALADDQWGASSGDVGQLTLALIIKVIVLLMFIVPLVVLMIVNMIRIFWIRIWVIFSPFIVLDQIFDGPLQKNDQVGKNFKLGNMLWLIFQPVAIVWLLSLGLILIIGVRDILAWWNEFEEGTLQDKLSICMNEDGSTFGCETGIAEVYVTGSFFQDLWSRVGGFVGEMILVVFTIFLLRSLVKAGFSMSEITKWVATSIYNFSEGMIKAIPLPWTSLSFASWSLAAKNITEKSGFEKKQRAQAANLNEKVDKFFNVDTSNDVPLSLHEKLIESLSSGNMKDMAKNFWGTMTTYTKNNRLMYGVSFKKALSEWFSRGQAIEYLVSENVITAEEAKMRPQEIMALPRFLSYIDHIMTTWNVPEGWAPSTSVSSLEGKVRGNK